MDMSWLRITKGDDNLLKFGSDGYVRYFAERFPSVPVSGWRVTAGRGSNQRRSIFRAFQCADHDGPRMPPDVVNLQDISCWPAADRASEYNRRLVTSNSARKGGRHYAAGCLYSRVPNDCLVIGDNVGNTPHVDVIIDVSPIGGCTHRKSVVMIRQLVSPEGRPLFNCDVGSDVAMKDLRTIVTYNS
jgi:hypothetical protein